MADLVIERRRVTIYTSVQCIEGEIHVPRGTRVSDRFNESRDFIPLTNVKVYSLAGPLLYARDALVVNKAHIVTLDDEPATAVDAPGPGQAATSAPPAGRDR